MSAPPTPSNEAAAGDKMLVTVRLTDEEQVANLEDLVQHTGMSKSAIFRRGFEELVKEIRRRGDAEWIREEPRPPLKFLERTASTSDEPGGQLFRPAAAGGGTPAGRSAKYLRQPRPARKSSG